MFKKRKIVILSIICVLALLVTTALISGLESTTRVSLDTAGGDANAASTNPAVSPNGNYVVFQSSATDIVSGGTAVQDIYKRDTSTNTTTLVSKDTSGSSADGASSNADVSSNGQYVVFESVATDIFSNDTNGVSDIFRRNTTNNTTSLISANTSGAVANAASNNASISSDGRYIAFDSTATDLISGGNATKDVYKRDATNGSTTVVSTDSSSTAGNGASSNPSISTDDGRYIVFQSVATNLVSNDTNGRSDIFLKDTTTNTTTRISTATGGTQATGGTAGSTAASISADGRYIVFQSDESNLVSNDTNAKTDIFIKDTSTNTTNRVSTNSSGAQASGNSTNPSISPDGRHVVFVSDATDLVTGDTNAKNDIFVKDTVAGTTTRISTNTAGTQATGDSANPKAASYAAYVAYDSAATDLVSGDGNSVSDVFLAKVDTTAPSTPSVSSSTHKSSSKYYKSTKPKFSWSATDSSGIGGYSYTLNTRSSHTPDSTSEGTGTSITYTRKGAGTWYFHIKAMDVYGNWSSTKHFKIHIDNLKPRTYAPKRYHARRRRGVATAKFYWRVRDSFTGNRAYVKLKIKRRVYKRSIARRAASYYRSYRSYKRKASRASSSSLARRYRQKARMYKRRWIRTRKKLYKHVKTVNYRWTRINRTRYYRWRLRTPGVYKFYVMAKDRARNTQRNVARNYVIVR